jgi:hypothetical protein
MAWTTTITTMVRYLINDVVEPYTYSDARLQQTIAVAAQIMLTELTFSNTYVIDLAGPTITPDPVDLTDNAFINLLALKTSCFMDQSLYRTKAQQGGIIIKTGSHLMDTSRNMDGYNNLLNIGPCKAYEDAKVEYVTGILVPGRAVLGAFEGINLDTSMLGPNGHSNRERFGG